MESAATSPLCKPCGEIFAVKDYKEGDVIPHYGPQALETSAKTCSLCARIWLLFVKEFKSAADVAAAVKPTPISAFNGWARIFARLESDIQVEFRFSPNVNQEKAALPLSLGTHLSVPVTWVKDYYGTGATAKVVTNEGWEFSPLSRKAVFDTLRDWVRTPLLDRIQDSATFERLLPTRLIRIDRGKALSQHPELQLVHGRGLPIATSYATLSHCWGAGQPIKLTRSNSSAFAKLIPFTQLPKTFKDAVQLALELDIRHIWIDSLCIVQDDPDDWLHESLLMASVYYNGQVNIAATASAGPEGGLFFPETLLRRPCLVDATWTGLLTPEKKGDGLAGSGPGDSFSLEQGRLDVFGEQQFFELVEHGPLNKRAWVLQEAMLSAKIIHCAADQIWWSSWQLTFNESFPKRTPWRPGSHLHRSRAHMTYLFQESFPLLWMEYIRQFSALKLTVDTDKLVALAGIAEWFGRVNGISSESWAAGMWTEPSLTMFLNWGLVSTPRRPGRYRAPSWSWASIDGEAAFHKDVLQPICDIIFVELETNGGPFGKVDGGYMLVEAPLIPCFPFQLMETGVETPTLDEPLFQYQGVFINLYPFDLTSPGSRQKAVICLDDPSDIDRSQPPNKFLMITCVKLLESEAIGLLLEPIPIESGDRRTYEGKFKRIGRFTIPLHHGLGLYLWSLTSEVDGPRVASSSSAIRAARPVSGQKSMLGSLLAGSLGDILVEKMSQFNVPVVKQPWIDPEHYLGHSRFSGTYTFKVV